MARILMKVNHDPLKIREHRLALEKDVELLKKKHMLEVEMNNALKRAFYRRAGDLPRLSTFLPLEIRELIAEVAVLEEEVVHLEDHAYFLQQDLQRESMLIAEAENQKHQSDYNQSNILFKICNEPCESKRQQLPLAASNSSRHVIVARMLGSQEKEPKINLQRRFLHNDEISKRNTTSRKQIVKQSGANSPCSVAKQILPETSPRLYASSSHRNVFASARSKECSPIGAASAFKKAQCGKENHKTTQISKVTSAVHQNPSKSVVSSKASPVSKMNLQNVMSGPKSQRALSLPLAAVSHKREANELSEEIMKCLLSVYCLMTKPNPSSELPTSSKELGSTFSSSDLQYHSSNSISVSVRKASEMSSEMNQPDPYFKYGERLSDLGPYKTFQSISANSFDYNRVADSASNLRRLRVMVETLGTVDLKDMPHQQKLAFWINIYNICMMHGFLEYGIPGSPHQVMALMHKAVLNVGGYLVNALAIEHYILRSPCHSKHAFADILCKEKYNMQSGLGLESPEPMACFALSCGSYSSPSVRVYTPSEIEGELETAKKDYLQAAIAVTTRHTVAIPKLLDRNSCDFAKDADSLMNWICQHIPVSLQKAVQECSNKANGALEVIPYDFTFRYLIA